MKDVKEITRIEDLKGEYLSDVCFVMDYVQFGFSGALIGSIANPIARIGGREWRFPEAESRDRLCSYIGRHLTEITVVDQVAITLRFESDEIVIPLDDANRRFGDAATFTPGHNKPGGDVF